MYVQEVTQVEEKTVINSQGKSTTLRTVIPSTVKKALGLKPKDKIVWHIKTNGTTEVTIRKEE